MFKFILMPCSCRDFLSEGCDEKTEIEIEVWDWDSLTPDERIGSVRVCLGDLILLKPINLIPFTSGQLIVRVAEFSDAAIETTTPEKIDRKRVNNYSFSFWGINCAQSREFFDLSRRLVSSKNWNLLCWSIRYVRRCPLDWRI